MALPGRPGRPRRVVPLAAAALVAALAVGLSGRAAEPPAPPAKPDKLPLVREIFVPFADLNALLENQPRRVLLGREEYEALLAKAKKAPEERAPAAFAVASAETVAAVAEDRARLTTTVLVDVLDDGLWAVPLDLAGVGLREALLDGKPASLGRGPDGRLTAFVEGKGRHSLVLEMVAPLQTTAAQQSLSFRLPRPAAARLSLTVPGDVEIKTGAEVASRVVDEAARVTRFEIVPRSGDMSLVMTLNSHLARQDRVVMAQSVTAYEVTQAYEGLHVTATMEVLHRAVDSFRFALPEGFEVTEVSSPLLARWNVAADGPRRVLEVKLREQTTERVRLTIAAMRAPARLDAWTAPRLEPLDVAGHVGFVGLLVEDRLQVQSLQPTGLVHVDVPVQSEAMLRLLPESVGAFARPAPGTPQLRLAAMFYAPQPEHALAARFAKLPARLAVTTNVVLVLSDQRQEVSGGFALLPEVEKLFELEFSVPAGWHVDTLADRQKRPIPFEFYPGADGPGRVRIRLAQGVLPGQTFDVRFHAWSAPAGWLGDWKSRPVAMPVFAVAGASRDVGAVAVAVAAADDMAVRLQSQERLVPLVEDEKQRYDLKDVATNLAYRYEAQPYQATFVAERTSPRLTATTYSFLKITPDALLAHYEVVYRIEEARAQALTLLLPADAPAALSIRALDGVRLKQYDPSKTDGGTFWTVVLAEPRAGDVRLAVDFQKPFSAQKAGQTPLPIVRAEGVAYQSGLVAVEGSAELDVQVKTDARRVHVGELAAAEYQPGKRLLGAYSFVGERPDVSVAVARQPGHPLYPAIVQKAELITLLSASGVGQTAATFELRTKSLFLDVVLPAGSKLWSAELNGNPIKPQREGDRLLVGLPDASVGDLCRLKIVYETAVKSLALTGQVQLPAPELSLRADAQAKAERVPLADLHWQVGLPSGYELLGSDGTVVPPEMERPLPAAVRVAAGLVGGLYYAGGGVPGPTYLTRRVIGAAALSELSNESRSMTPQAAMKSEGAKAPSAGIRYQAEDARYFEKKDDSKEDFPKSPPADLHRLELKPDGAKEEAPKAPEDKPMEKPAEKPAEKPVQRPPEPKMPEAKPEPTPRIPGKSEPAPPPPPPRPTPPASTVTKPKPGEFQPDKPLGKGGKYVYDLTGMRALQIELGVKPEEPGTVVAFQSLGEEPLLSVTLANRPRLDLIGLALALLVALAGVLKTNCTARSKARFILLVAAVATLVPVLPGCEIATGPANMAVYAAAALVPYYLVVGLVRWLAPSCCRKSAAANSKASCAAGAAVVLAAVLAPMPGQAQAPNLPIVQVIEPLPPVTVPEDAIIIPYDPDSDTGIRDAKKLMVPYAKYVELWNRAYPDKKLDEKAPPAPYALSGASYTARLSGDEYLQLDGRLAIDVFGDQFVTVPLALDGGVLARAELDGKPAQISVPAVEPPAANPPAPQQVDAVKPQAAAKFFVLQIQGKGRHELTFAVRMRLERRGGWRVAAGALPAAPASALAITVPEPKTEVRLDEIPDRPSYDTAQPDQKIETALGDGGRLRVEWRPKVTEGQIDRGLTAQSAATLDVQEDGLGLLWQLSLEFPRSQRDRFTVAAPAGYLVQKVEGGNVRGWTVRADPRGQTVEVALLKPAKDRESFALRLWRKGPVGAGELVDFDVPAVRVPEAAMQKGTVAIRRSPTLDVETVSTAGAARTEQAPPARGAKPDATQEESKLGIQPYQVYGFVSVPFTVRLSVRPTVARVRAEVQTVLKLNEIETGLESRVKLDVQDRPIYRVEVFLPEGLARETVAGPPGLDWAVTEVDKRRLLTVYLARGQRGAVELLVTGKMPGKREGDQVPVPRLEVRGAVAQRSDVAVQSDPAVKVELRNPANLESVPLGAFDAWLANPAQRAATRLALRSSRPDYSGTLALSAERSEVACTTISNVRVTKRAVEETVLLDFTARGAGVRELVFLLPALPEKEQWRISVPELRQKTVAPAEGGAPGMVRVRLELQDAKTGRILVQVENDRLLVRDRDYQVPIPVVETAATVRQFVTLESRGRDEVLPGKPQGLEPIGREQGEWKVLEGYGLGGIIQAYAVVPGGAAPGLAFRTRERAEVETVEASVGLAETDLAMDASGAYRADVVYGVFNSTEQFLQIALPPGAKLWTAWVAGQPVKPAEVPQGAVPAGDPRVHVRVPLVKTAAGERDYEVHIQYGGRVDPPSNFRRTRFPLAATVNIRAERSTVRLRLPEQFQWYDFRGTMGRAEDEGSVQAQKLGYLNKMTERLLQTSRGSEELSTIEAANNLKQVELSVSAVDDLSRKYAPNAELQQALSANAALKREAQQQIRQVESAPQQAGETDNRSKLNAVYQRQELGRARNVVQDLGGNWDAATLNAGAAQPGAGSGTTFNDAWLDRNGLLNPSVVDTKELGHDRAPRFDLAAEIPAESPDPLRRPDGRDKSGDRAGGGEMGAGGQARVQLESLPQQQTFTAQQPQAAQIADESLKGKLRKVGAGDVTKALEGRQKDTVTRYRERLSQQQAVEEQTEMMEQAGAQPFSASRTQGGAVSADSLLSEDGVRSRFKAHEATRPRSGRGGAYHDALGSVGFGRGDEDYNLRDVQNKAFAWEGFRSDLPGPGIDGPGPGVALAGVPKGMASLQVTLPKRGDVYLFTTPGGECEIVARSASTDSIRGVVQAAVVLVVVLLALAAIRAGRGRRWTCSCGRGFSTALIALGVLAALLGFFPVYGLVAVVVGIAMKVRRRVGQVSNPHAALA